MSSRIGSLFLALSMIASALAACTPPPHASAVPAAPEPGKEASVTDPVVKSDAEWKKILTPEQYRVLREKGTEAAFTGLYYDAHDKGVYRCAACGAELFSSETKFESGSGWPSFFAPIASINVKTDEDTSHGMRRVEVSCARCGGHLGHVFDDGPAPTQLRYCINSAALTLEKKP